LDRTKAQTPTQNVAVIWIDDYCAARLTARKRFVCNSLNARVDRQENVGSLLRRIFRKTPSIVPFALRRK